MISPTLLALSAFHVSWETEPIDTGVSLSLVSAREPETTTSCKLEDSACAKTEPVDKPSMAIMIERFNMRAP